MRRVADARSIATPSCTPAFAGRCRRDFNIAEVCCARWAREHARRGRDPLRARGRRARATSPTPSCSATPTGSPHALRRLGVARGDRVAIVMPQRFETAVAHIALYQLGAVAMPLSMLFGPDALEYR